jgi:oxygen-independent coproporphyrinogen-3 oxidase
MDIKDLVKKYNVAAPRYTSYPTVPYWERESINPELWAQSVVKTYQHSQEEGVSLYIHLPYCESLCTYCGCNNRITKNHQVEIPYINAVVKEWKMYVTLLGEKPKLKELHLGGGTPTFFSAENLALLLSGIHNAALISEEAEFSFEAHPANTTPSHLNTLYGFGFKRLSLGIQDFDPKVQMLINRFQTPEQVNDITRMAREIGYTSINFDLIYGLPGQTIRGLEETLNEVILMKPDRIAFYSYAHVPWLKPGQRHYTEKDLPVGDAKFALYQLGKDKLLQAGYKDVGMDHFATVDDSLYLASANKRLHRNFMGYTDQHTQLLIGLGVSSISDSWLAFAQNPKTVEAYLEKINEGIIPMEKGHLLTEEDLLVRKHILNIMCNAKTYYEEGIPTAVLGRLIPLLNDGLIEFDKYNLEVTVLGTSFLRNICMALDERLWRKQPETHLFSSTV